jgi:EAL domain-containing protein (putative c-di-GMP-specific phosphodiesterase class I)
VTRAVLTELQELGIRIAIDDFGTGYSALGALRDYQVDMIKIDRGFTARIDTEDGKELVLAMLKIARIYGADVVAEGVETVVERDILRATIAATPRAICSPSRWTAAFLAPLP